MRLAAELDADVAVDVGVAERAVRVRVEAGRVAAEGDTEQDEAIVARADEIRAALATPPPLTDDEVAELRTLAADLGRAARIRQRTETRAQEVLQARVAASTGVAIHPQAVASAAEAVVAAEQALADAEAAIAAVVEDDGPAVVLPAAADPVLRLPHDDFDEALLERRRGRLRAVVLASVVVVAAGVAVAVGAPVLVLPAAAVVALLLAVALLAGGRRAATRVEPDPEPEPQAVAEPSVDAVADAVAADQRLAARDSAREQLRAARNRWHQLAGADADPHDPAAVVRAHDPQLAYDERIAEASPTVRTVAAFHRRAQARWRVVWAGMGRDVPPSPDELEAVLDELLADHRAAAAEHVLLEAALARVEARAAARRPLLLVEPQTWVTPGRLAQLLASVPPDGEVVLVEKG
jgi:hypothetical protein